MIRVQELYRAGLVIHRWSQRRTILERLDRLLQIDLFVRHFPEAFESAQIEDEKLEDGRQKAVVCTAHPRGFVQVSNVSLQLSRCSQDARVRCAMRVYPRKGGLRHGSGGARSTSRWTPAFSPEIRPCHATPDLGKSMRGTENSVTALFPGRSTPLFPKTFRSLNKTEPSRTLCIPYLPWTPTNRTGLPNGRGLISPATTVSFQLPVW